MTWSRCLLPHNGSLRFALLLTTAALFLIPPVQALTTNFSLALNTTQVLPLGQATGFIIVTNQKPFTDSDISGDDPIRTFFFQNFDTDQPVVISLYWITVTGMKLPYRALVAYGDGTDMRWLPMIKVTGENYSIDYWHAWGADEQFPTTPKPIPSSSVSTTPSGVSKSTTTTSVHGNTTKPTTLKPANTTIVTGNTTIPTNTTMVTGNTTIPTNTTTPTPSETKKSNAILIALLVIGFIFLAIAIAISIIWAQKQGSKWREMHPHITSRI